MEKYNMLISKTWFKREIIFRYIGELSISLIPLGTIAITKFIFNKFEFLPFITSIQFSFALVSSCALLMYGFLDLKAKSQRDFSYKFFEGIKILTLLLIISVLGLSISILVELEVVDLNQNSTTYPSTEVLTYATINITLAVIVFYFLLYKVYLQVTSSLDIFEINSKRSKSLRFAMLKRSIEEINSEISKTTFSINVIDPYKHEINEAEYFKTKEYLEKELNSITSLVQQTIKISSEMNLKLENRKKEILNDFQSILKE